MKTSGQFADEKCEKMLDESGAIALYSHLMTKLKFSMNEWMWLDNMKRYVKSKSLLGHCVDDK